MNIFDGSGIDGLGSRRLLDLDPHDPFNYIVVRMVSASLGCFPGIKHTRSKERSIRNGRAIVNGRATHRIEGQHSLVHVGAYVVPAQQGLEFGVPRKARNRPIRSHDQHRFTQRRQTVTSYLQLLHHYYVMGPWTRTARV